MLEKAASELSTEVCGKIGGAVGKISTSYCNIYATICIFYLSSADWQLVGWYIYGSVSSRWWAVILSDAFPLLRQLPFWIFSSVMLSRHDYTVTSVKEVDVT